MFKFNFNIDEKENDDESALKNMGEVEPIAWFDSKEVLPDIENLEMLEAYKLNSKEILIGNEVALAYMLPKFIIDSKANKSINVAEDNHSDLIPGVYEGGAKMWECTLDLLNYLNDQHIEWSGKKVLDLGCGCGLLGVFALKNGSIVHFQDYNEDVLQNITIPNVLLNMNENLSKLKNVDKKNLKDLFHKEMQQNVKFYSGDWSKYIELTTTSEQFDFILTSETIYNPENQKKLLETFAAKLKPNGKIYVAAKSYYFGVGGNVRQFEELVKKDNRFESNNVWKSEEGVQREILELNFLKQS